MCKEIQVPLGKQGGAGRMEQRRSHSDPELQAALAPAARRVLKLTRADGASIELLDGTRLFCGAGCGQMAQFVGTEMVRSSLLDSALEGGPVRQAADEPLQYWERAAGAPPRIGSGGRWAIMAAALRRDKAVVGLVRVIHQVPHEFSERDMEQFWIAADALGMTVELFHVTQRVRSSESMYRSLFARNPLPMYMSDSSRKLLAANASMLAHYGYSESEMLELSAGDLLLDRDPQKIAEALRSTAASTKIEGLKQRHRKRDGTPIDVEIWVDTFVYEGNQARMVLIYDVTERLQAERELARLGRAQRMLSACNEAQIGVESEMAFLHRICSIAVDIGGYTLAFVGYAQHDEEKSIMTVAQAGSQAAFVEHFRPTWHPDCPRGKGPSGRAIRSGRSVVMSNLPAMRDQLVLAEIVMEQGHRSCVSLPLREKDQTFGAFTLFSPEVLDIGSEELRLLEELSNNLAFGIASLRAQKQQRQAQEAQQRIQAAVVKIAAAVSAAGQEFFVQLAWNMADALGAQAGFVARLAINGTLDAHTLGAVIHGKVQPDFDVILKGSVCENIYEASEWQVTEGVAAQFSSTPLPAVIGANAFVARRLDNAAGEPIGLILVAFCDGLKDPDFIASTLQIFAARAASEMERQGADTRIRDQASYLDKAQDAIMVRGMDHGLQFWNKSAERLYGWRSVEVLGRNGPELLAVDPQEFQAAMAILLETGEWHGEGQKQRKDGTELVIESRWTLIRDEAGQPKTVLVIDTDISARRQADLKIKKLAFFDALTDLPNRLLLADRLQQALVNTTRRHQGGAILLIDLDNFKSINDTWGHDRGDLLLQEVALRLRGCARETDTIARLGGDEFIILLSGLSQSLVTIAADAQRVAEKILLKLKVPYLIDGIEYQGSASIGISRFIDQTESANDLLKQADIAMYDAKSAGRNTLRFFDSGLQAAVTARAELEVDLRNALVQGEFLLYYQPQVDSGGAVMGVEALVRWQSPARGMVSPATFIPLCEETGLILDLGRLVLEMACEVQAAWQGREALAGLSIAVNVSSRQFQQQDFVSQVRRALDRTGAKPGRIKLELTESVLADDMEGVIEKMVALKAMGVSFSLDDFGTGYSSLSYLKRLPLDQLKIDQSFVRDILTDANDATIAKTVIALGRSFGLEVIAEGVEEQGQCDFLAEHGCHAYQGYLFSRPLPLGALEQFLADSSRSQLNRESPISLLAPEL